MNDLDIALDFLAEMILLCEKSYNYKEIVFRKKKIGVGDYMGSGYAFLDAYNRIYDKFLMEGNNSFWEKLKKKN